MRGCGAQHPRCRELKLIPFFELARDVSLLHSIVRDGN